MLGAHPDVFTFPETHYFRKVFGRLWPWRRLGVVSPRAARVLTDRPLQAVGAERTPGRSWSPLFVHYGHRFVAVVDAAADSRDRGVWVEKSPSHLHCTDQIAAVVPSPTFVHVVRDGCQVVASFYEVCRHTPGWIRQVLPD